MVLSTTVFLQAGRRYTKPLLATSRKQFRRYWSMVPISTLSMHMAVRHLFKQRLTIPVPPPLLFSELGRMLRFPLRLNPQ